MSTLSAKEQLINLRVQLDNAQSRYDNSSWAMGETWRRRISAIENQIRTLKMEEAAA